MADVSASLPSRPWSLTAFVVLATTAAAHPDSQARTTKGFTLTVGTALSITGTGSVFGPVFQKNAEFAADLANKALAQDGINDITIKVDSADDGSDPTTAAAPRGS